VTLPLILPLLAGIGYAASALVIKRASEFGVGVWRTAFVANVIGALVFQPLWLLGGNLLPELWWQPLETGFRSWRSIAGTSPWWLRCSG
jgi:drug/metabolite transporter (DMT)-like permease